MTELEVARFSTIPEGELAVALLCNHGISARLPDRDMATMNPDLLIAIGNVRVVAPDHQVQAARALIARVRAGDFAQEAEADVGDWMIDAAPGRVGEIDEGQIGGVMSSAKKAGIVVMILAFVVFPLFSCVMSTGRY
jgi:hypothetical protein